MTSPQPLEPLVESSLKPVCTAAGPFVTAYLAAYRPGASELPAATRLKALIRNAAAELERRRYRERVEDLLAPFEQLAADPATQGGIGNSVIFGAPDFFRRLGLAAPAIDRIVVAAHPHITPALPGLIAEREFFILEICRKELRLGRWRDGECAEAPLPASVPKSMDEALNFKQPDHNMEGRSTAGGAAGQFGGVRFSTSADREKADKYEHNYLKIVDRELAPVLRGSLLVVIGTEEELAAYRRASEYPRVLEARPTSGDRPTWFQMGELAQQEVLRAARVEAEKALSEALETPRRDRILSGAREVLRAAHDGRVHKLLLAAGTEQPGRLGRLLPKGEARIEGEQDLVNAAAVETIRAGGEVHVVEPDGLGEWAPALAILRY